MTSHASTTFTSYASSNCLSMNSFEHKRLQLLGFSPLCVQMTVVQGIAMVQLGTINEMPTTASLVKKARLFLYQLFMIVSSAHVVQKSGQGNTVQYNDTRLGQSGLRVNKFW